MVINPSVILDDMKTQIKEREKLLNSKHLINNKEAEMNYIDYDLKFNSHPVEVTQQILKAEDYNVSELDSVQEVWKKTSKAIKLLNEKENQNKRIFRSI